MPLIEIVDFNRDAMFDLTFVDKEGQLVVLYNQYQAQGPKESNLCSESQSTEYLAQNPMFASYPFVSGDNALVESIVAKSTGWTYNGLASSMPGSVPGRLRIADFNSDSYPDISLTISFTDSEDTSFTWTGIALNEEKTNSTDGSRILVEQEQGEYQKVTDTAGDFGEFVTFIDIDEDGKLDLLVQKFQNGVPYITPLYNNIASDSFFVKANMVNTQLEKNDNIYSDNAIGASYRFVVTDLNDKKFVIVGSQSYQSGYMSIQLPYSYLGVGRSNNYIETFYAGTSIGGQKAERMWTPIIPNS